VYAAKCGYQTRARACWNDTSWVRPASAMMMPLKALKALLLGAAVLCVVGNAGAKDEDNTAPAAAKPAATPEAPPTPKPEKKLHPIAKITTMKEWNKMKEFAGFEVAVVAFISSTCGHCKNMQPAWEAAHQAIESTDILLAEVDVDTKDKELKKETDSMMIQNTPTIKIMRRGVLPATYEQEKDKESLLLLLGQLQYKNSQVLLSKRAVEEFFIEAMEKPSSTVKIRAYVMINMENKEDEKSFTEVAAYAMQQGAMGVKYAVCPKKLLAYCRIDAGQARLWRYDLPEEQKQDGILLQKPLSDARAFHIFSRGGIVPAVARIGHVNEISFYNSATIPVVYLIANKNDEEKAFPREDDIKQLGWDYMGRVSFVIVTPKFILENVKHFNNTFAESDGARARLCKFATSSICYKYEDYDTRFDGTISRDWLKNWIDAFLEGDISFIPRSGDPYKYVQENSKSVVQWVVGNQFTQYVSDKSIDRIIFLTHEDCASCKAFFPSFVQLANVASERAKIIKFGAMDCKDNDPPDDIEVHAYPRLVYYKDGSKQPYTLQPSDMFPVIQGILKEKLNQNIEWRKTDDEL